METVGRGHAKNHPYCNAKPGFLFIALEKVYAFRPDWHRDDQAKPIVRQYQIALRAVLRKHRELACCLVRCRYCGIRFLTHPCNARRRDLHCPFGCRKEHRRQCANRRSAKHYQTLQGRRNKKARNGQRSCREQSCHGGSQFAGLADLAPSDDSATSHSRDGQSDQPTGDPSVHGGPPVDLADASATFNARGNESDQLTGVKSAPTRTGVEYS